MPGRLDGKVALVTGAARGQGRAHAVRLAQEGADILVLDAAGPLPDIVYPSATVDDMEETGRLIDGLGRRVLTRQGDVRDLEGLKDFVAEGVSTLGSIDIVVANAAIATPETWDNITPEMWKDTIDINLTGVWNTVMATAPRMVEAGRGGSIILVSSLAGKKPQPFMVHYTASKHGVTGLVKAFAAELGPHRIRVNSIHPGPVNSPMSSQELRDLMARLVGSNPPLGATLTPFLPEAMAECEDQAAAAAFLASDDARMITGETLSVDQGMQWF
jgi:SDR family mycofactocin-dependent oxidoreductase